MYFPILARSAKSAFTRVPSYQFTSCGIVSCLQGVHTHNVTRTLDDRSPDLFTTRRKKLLEGQCPRADYRYRGLSSDQDHQTESPDANSFTDRLQEAPSPALYLGFAGLLPFVGPALFCLGSLSYSPFLAFMQVTYGATVLSFLGGIHWGYSIDNETSPPSWRNLGYSVIPPLIAWGGLLLTAEFGTLLLMTGFAIAWRRDVKVKTMPSWFRALRVCLSVGAILSLGLTYTMGLLYPPPDTSTTYNWVKLMKIVKIILED